MAIDRGIRYIPAIDGLRAVAVIAVMLYHLGISWIPGGFLGVDLFFVISGYVITRLLLDSIARSGGLDLRAFYKARIRRLLPPLVFMIIVTSVYIGIWAPETMRRFVTDSPFALFGGMNWWLVFRHTDYFDSIARPALLQHTWSLGVEAQFYLVWPLILLLVLRYFGKNKIPGAALLIAAISGIALLVVSFQVDAASASQISHVYFGTDTHSIGLFLGAALAVSWIPQNLKENVNQRAQDFIDGIGIFGFIGMIATFLFINETDPTLYKLAFPLAGVFGCAIITSVVHPASRFAPILSSKVMVWMMSILLAGNSINAIKQSDEAMAVIKAEINAPIEMSPDVESVSGAPGIWVTGDSVILGIRHELDARKHIDLINARVGRQAAELIDVMNHDKLNMVGATVIFNLGNNNKLTQAQVISIFEEVKNQPQIIVVNTAVPRAWRDENNALIAQYSVQYGALLVDWAAISLGHPEFFAPDGVHLVPAGVRAYVDAISINL